jgi:glycosyltransferase involved in cell wall biosynthesis
MDYPQATAVIPHIPTPHREETLKRAVKSVRMQSTSQLAQRVYVVNDTAHAGSAATRNRGLAEVTTEYTAFLDDDDEWLPHHVTTLMDAARETGADIIYPWFTVVSSHAFDPFPGAFRRKFDAGLLRERNYIPTTVLARTELVQDVGGFEPHGDQQESACDDWGLWLKLLDVGAMFHHVPMVTWLWHWHGRHTSGLPSRW